MVPSYNKDDSLESQNCYNLEKAKKLLQLSEEETETVSRLVVKPNRVRVQRSFYEEFASRGIRVDRIEPGFTLCSFKVPPRLTENRSGNLATGAIASLIDIVSGSVIPVDRDSVNVSVDMSISYLSTANVNDELEITARALGQKGGYFGTAVVVRNKANGEVIAEGRHSLFNSRVSKL